MPKFQKKPLIIDAVQWFPGIAKGGVIVPDPRSMTQFQPYISTLEGAHLCTPGDWIVSGIKGEKYPVKDEIFRKTYQPIDEKAQKTWEENLS